MPKKNQRTTKKAMAGAANKLAPGKFNITADLRKILEQGVPTGDQKNIMGVALQSLVKSALKGNVNAVNTLIRHINMAELAAHDRTERRRLRLSTSE